MTNASLQDGVFNPLEMCQMNAAINAVCDELGIRPTDQPLRERVAGSVISSWSRGGRLPLDLVRAGLDGARVEHA